MNDDTLLFRQVHPDFIDGGEPTTQAFKGNSNSQDRLSVYDGDKITAEDSWRHYVGSLKKRSAGVVAVTVGECRAAKLNIRPDSSSEFPEHVLIELGEMTRGERKNVAADLTDIAKKRGWRYRVDSQTGGER